MLWKDGTLILGGGEKLDGRVVCLDSNLIEFLPDGAKDRLSFSTEEVSAFTARGDRAFGTFAGAVMGGIIGGLAGSTVENERSGWIDLINEHDVSIVGGVVCGAAIGGFAGYAMFSGRTSVTFEAPDPSGAIPLSLRRGGQSTDLVAVLVRALDEDNEDFVSFDSGGKMIRLQRSQISLERRSDGILIRATRGTFWNAGLQLH